jgi:sporulation protein YlmC with PRC-barrel domain
VEIDGGKGQEKKTKKKTGKDEETVAWHDVEAIKQQIVFRAVAPADKRVA